MKIDNIGRIVIPAYLREYLGLHRKNKLVFEQRPDAIRSETLGGLLPFLLLREKPDCL